MEQIDDFKSSVFEFFEIFLYLQCFSFFFSNCVLIFEPVRWKLRQRNKRIYANP